MVRNEGGGEHLSNSASIDRPCRIPGLCHCQTPPHCHLSSSPAFVTQFIISFSFVSVLRLIQISFPLTPSNGKTYLSVCWFPILFLWRTDQQKHDISMYYYIIVRHSVILGIFTCHLNFSLDYDINSCSRNTSNHIMGITLPLPKH